MSSPLGSEMQQHYNNNYNVNTGIGPLTDNIFNSLLDRVTTDKFRERLTNQIVDPTIDMLNHKLRPYINMAIAAYVLLVVLLIVIIYLQLRKK